VSSDFEPSFPRNAFTKYSFDLDGSADCINFGDVAEFAFERTDSFSVSGWFKTSTTSAGSLVGRMDNLSPFRGWEIVVQSTGEIRFQIINTNGSNEIKVDTTATVNDDEWHHFLATYDGSSAAAGVAIYIDGAVDDNIINDTLSATTVQASINFTIGGRDAASPFFDGKLADIAIFNKELSSLEATELYNSGETHDLNVTSFADSLISWWRCGDGDNAGRFHAIDEHVDFGNFTEVDFAKADTFSAGMWIKYSGTNLHVLMSKANTGTLDGWEVSTGSGLDAGDFVVTFGDGSGSFTGRNNSGLLNDGEWHQIVFTYDGSNAPGGISLYVDGVSVGVSTSGSALAGTLENTGSLRVGGRTTSNEFRGSACHSFIYDTQLSATDVRIIYGKGFPQDLGSVGPTGSLVHWCPLGDGCDIGANNCPDLSGLGNHGTTSGVESSDFIENDFPGAILGSDGETMPDASSYDDPGTLVNTIPEDFQGDSAGGISQFSMDLVNPPENNTYSSITTSMLFDGVDEYVNFGSVGSMDVERTDPFTWAVWYKTSVSSTDYALAKGDGLKGWALGVFGTGQAYFELREDDFGNLLTITSSGTINDGAWHFVVVTFNGSSAAHGLNMYIDGILQRDASKNGSIATGTTISGDTLTVGARNSGASSLWVGNIMHAAGWNKELSRAEVTELFYDSQPQDLTLVSTSGNLVWWSALGDGDGLGAGAVLDLSGNANHGTATNMEVGDFVADVPAAADFGRYISAPHNSDLYRENGYPWSISFWIKTTTTNGGHCVGKFWSGTSSLPGIGIDLDTSGRPRLHVAPGVSRLRVRSDVAVNDGQWHHVVGTQKKRAANDHIVSFYIDGVAVATTTELNSAGNSSIAAAGGFSIGAIDGGINPVAAKIDEVGYYNKSLSASEAAALYNSGSPPNLHNLDSVDWLLGWWRMGDRAGHYGDNVSFVATTKNGDAPGAISGYSSATSMKFGSSTDRVSLGNVLDKTYTDAFSISAWIFSAKTTGGDGIIAQKFNSVSGPGWRFSLGSSAGSVSGLNFRFAGTGQVWTQTVEQGTTLEGGAVVRNRWFHVVATYDGSGNASGSKIYVDGVAQTMGTVVDNLTAGGSTTAPMYIGATSGALTGSIDEVTMWDKELSAAEVADLYNNGVPGDPSLETFSPNLEGWWKMDGEIVGADTWNTYTDIVWSTGNYSWIILQKPTTGSQLLIDCERSSSRDLRMYWSPNGNYVGGDITTKPTASDEVTLQTSGPWNGNLSVYGSWVHVWHSQDGALTRVVVTNDQQDPSLFWILDEIEDPFPNNWSHPEIVGIYEGLLATSRDAISDSPVINNAAKAYQNGLGAFDVVLGGMGNDAQASGFGGYSWVTEQFYGKVGNELASLDRYPMAPLILTSDTVGARGVHGFLTDIWWGHEDRTIGTTYPASTTAKEFVQFEHVVLPWTGSSDVPVVSGPAFDLTMPDESTNTNDATLTNMEFPDVSTDVPGGSFSQSSLSLDGVNEYGNIGDVAELGFEYNTPFSISAWVKTSSAGTMAVYSKVEGGSPFQGYELLMVAGEVVLEIINSFSGSYIRVDTVTTFHDNNWHHIVATYNGSSDASGCAIYVDGIARTLALTANTLSGSIVVATPAQIGARDATIPFNGSIDDVAVYDKELTPFEVAEIWNSTSDPGAGNSNRSTAFGGSNEYATSPNPSELDFERTDTFSVSWWFRVSGASVGYFVSKFDSAPTGWGVYMESNGNVQLWFQNTDASNRIAVETTGTDWSDDSWHHAVVTYDGSELASGVTIYVDDISQPLNTISDTLALTTLNSGDLNISGRTNGTSVLTGSVDDVAVYNIELDGYEVSDIYNSGSPTDNRLLSTAQSMVGYWTMGDGDVFPNLRDRQVTTETTVSGGVFDRSKNSNDGTPTNMEDADFRAVILASETMPDLSGNGNAGTPTNMEDGDFTTDTPGGNSWYSATFDGVNEEVVVGDVAAVKFTDTTPFSWSVWFKSSSATNQAIVHKRVLAGNNEGYEIRLLSSGAVAWTIRDSGSGFLDVATVATTFADGAWHHLVCTYDGSGNRSGLLMFADGASSPLVLGSDTLAGSIDTSTGLRFGLASDGVTNPFNGLLDEIAVYDKALSLAEVQAIYNGGITVDNRTLSTVGNLVGYWGCGDSGPGGVARHVMRTDGTNEYINFGNISEASFERTDDFSFSIWVRPNSTASQHHPISKVDTGFNGWLLYHQPGGGFNFTLSNTGTFSARIETTGTYTNQEWYHVVGTYVGSSPALASNLTLYVNGVAVPTSITEDDLGTNSILNAADFRIASRDFDDSSYNGWITEAVLFDRTLTQAHVTALYNNGMPPDPTHLGIGGIVGYWQCGPSANDATMTNMEATDFLGDVPGLTVAGSGFPTDLSINGPTSNLVGYWLMGDGLISTTEVTDDAQFIGFGASRPNGVEVTNYVMVGIDSGAPAGLYPAYHYWTVQDAPDLTGAQAGTPAFGGPLVNIRVSAEFQTVSEE
jgi:hypothetical protein